MHRCYWCGLWLGIVLTIWGSIPGVSLTQTIQVAATVETEPVPSKDDAADDPCVWIYPTAPSRSTIIGTDKKDGLAVYDLAGHTLQYLPDGRLNNVDIRVGFHWVASLWILSQQAIGAVNRDPIVAQLSKLAITQASCSNQDRILGYR